MMKAVGFIVLALMFMPALQAGAQRTKIELSDEKMAEYLLLSAGELREEAEEKAAEVFWFAEDPAGTAERISGIEEEIGILLGLESTGSGLKLDYSGGSVRMRLVRDRYGRLSGLWFSRLHVRRKGLEEILQSFDSLDGELRFLFVQSSEAENLHQFESAGSEEVTVFSGGDLRMAAGSDQELSKRLEEYLQNEREADNRAEGSQTEEEQIVFEDPVELLETVRAAEQRFLFSSARRVEASEIGNEADTQAGKGRSAFSGTGRLYFLQNPRNIMVLQRYEKGNDALLVYTLSGEKDAGKGVYAGENWRVRHHVRAVFERIYDRRQSGETDG